MGWIIVCFSGEDRQLANMAGARGDLFAMK